MHGPGRLGWLLLLVACPVGAATILIDPVLNGDFAGDPRLGVPSESFWQGASADQCRREGERTFLHLSSGQSVRQRVAVPAALADQAVLHVLVRGAGEAALAGVAGGGSKGRATPGAGWQELTLRPDGALPPYRIELSAVGGDAEFTAVRLESAWPAVTPEELAARIESAVGWAVGEYLALSADDDGPVATGLDARRYHVVTGARQPASSGYVADLDHIPHTLRFLALLTGADDWRQRFLVAAEAVLKYNVGEGGEVVAWDCRADRPRPGGRQGYAELLELLLDAGRLSGDPRFLQAALALGDRVREVAPRPDGGLAWALLPGGRRFDAYAYYQDHIYGMGHPVALGRLYRETGDGRFLTLARRAAEWELATLDLAKYARATQIDPWCDDYFGIIGTGLCALHQETGRDEFLQAALTLAGQLRPVWAPSLGNGSHTAGDQPRTWDVWCYLAGHGGPATDLAAVRLAARQAVNYRQDVDTIWKDFNTRDYGPWDVGQGSPPLNLLAGLSALSSATRDPEVLAWYAAVFDGVLAGFRRPHGILSRLPSPTAPEAQRAAATLAEGSFELPRFCRIALRLAAACREVPTEVGQHGFPILREPALTAIRREQPAADPAPPDLEAWREYFQTPTWAVSAQPGAKVLLAVDGGAFAYVDGFSDWRRWKESVHDVAVSPGAALGWQTYYGASFGEYSVGLGPAGATGSFTWRFTLPKRVATLVVKDTHVAWSGSDRVRLSWSTDGTGWREVYDAVGLGKAAEAELDLAAELGGARELSLRYDFAADQRERSPGDRRGACLRRFELRGTVRPGAGE